MFTNKTIINVSKDLIEIKHTPLPWLGNKVLKSTDFTMFYTKEIVIHAKGGISRSYQLHGTTQNGKVIKLIKGIDNGEHAIFIENEITKYLGL